MVRKWNEKLPKDSSKEDEDLESIEPKNKQNDLQKLSHTRMLFTGVGHMVLLVIGFMIHPIIGGMYAIYWLFGIPYLEMRKIQKKNQKKNQNKKALNNKDREEKIPGKE